MSKIRLSNFEISEIEENIDSFIKDRERIIFNYNDMKDVAHFAVATILQMIDTKVDDLLTVDEAAETFQNLLDLVNDKKYKPLLDFLNKRGE